MPIHDDLSKVLSQQTWDKELILWLGPESKLLPSLTNVQVNTIDLLNLFAAIEIPGEDDGVRKHLSRSLRQYLKSVPRVVGKRIVLIVRSAGLLARYRVGVQDFYDWFCNDFALAILIVEGTCHGTEWPEDVECSPDQLVDYFNDSGIVQRFMQA
jgi:hypothetical protein